jgi:DNA-binding response OmpR family regulator
MEKEINQFSAKYAFVLEDDAHLKNEIELKMTSQGYNVIFFDKSTSIFDLLDLGPDIVICDYVNNVHINCKELNLV